MRRGRAEPISVDVQVSGSKDGSVSTSVTTMCELDGRVVLFSGPVPCRSGDELWVAGYWQPSGVFRALAYRLPRQGVLVGDTSRWVWWIGAGLCAIGCVLCAAIGVGFYHQGTDRDWSQLPVIILFAGLFMLGGRAVMRSSTADRRAYEMLHTGTAVSGQGKTSSPSPTSWMQPPSVPRR